MKYCKNCGKETTAKICPHCGSNSKKAKNYCEWCGNKIDGNVVICPNCHERLKERLGSKVCMMFGVAFSVLSIVCAWACFIDNEIPPTVLLIFAALLSLPLVKNLIKKITFGKKWRRKVLYITRVIAVLALFITASVIYTPSETVYYYNINDKQATEAALEVFHSEVSLKNEASFVLNDATVIRTGTAEDDDDIEYVTVYLDYSAQNGFGGMNRKTYRVQLTFQHSTGIYRNRLE